MSDDIMDLKAKVSAYETVFGCVKKMNFIIIMKHYQPIS